MICAIWAGAITFGFEVYGHNFAMITGLDLRQNLRFIDFIIPLSQFLHLIQDGALD